jgi:DUF4097 and DUF4098 domain-containing protein YvlB
MTPSRLLAGLACCLVSGCIAYPHRAEIEDERSLDIAGIERVEIETRNGAVEVICSAGASSSTLESRRTARGMSEEDALSHAESILVETGRDPARPGVLRIAARIPTDMSGRSPGCGFRLEMPRGADIHVRTSNGDIVLEGVRGGIDAGTSNGRVEVEDAVGPVRARSSNGAIRLATVRGDADVSTSNGEVVLTDVTAGALSVATSNGSISVRSPSLPRSPSLRAVTSNGSVTIEVPRDVGARITLGTSNGRISPDFGGASVSGLETSRNRVEAVLNQGGGEIEARTSNGEIIFRASGAPGTRHI